MAAMMITVLTSCDEDSLGIEDNVRVIPLDASIKPLTKGNQWIYSVTNFDTLGNSEKQDDEVHNIISSREIENETWFTEQIGSGPATIDQTNREDGLWYISGSEKIRLTKYPLDGSGDIINEYTHPQSGTLQVVRNATETNVLINTDAGKFRCIKYVDRLQKTNGGIIREPVNISWFSPNIGLVRVEIFKEKSSGSQYLAQIRELKSYLVR